MHENIEEKEEDQQIKAQCVPIVVGIFQIIFPIMWQSIIEATVFFFTTLGLETWWSKQENKKNKGE